jgi:hypothetical protein
MINEFRVSTDGTLFAFYDPGNGPWFVPKPPLEEWTPGVNAEGWGIPEPWMQGRFIGSDKIDGFGFEWVRFLPVHLASREVLRVVKEWVEGEGYPSPAAERLIVQLERKGYSLLWSEEDE